jgi:diguanylate cyclase (GGDEF)-like protein
MNDNSVNSEQLKALKTKLDAAIKSRASMADDFKKQSTMLINFIGKLSQVSKGLDLKLDNKLANFRSLVKKSAPVSDIETEISNISSLLNSFSVQNEKNIENLNQQFLDAGKSLQKTNGLPNQLRRDLRELLKHAEDGKDTIIQYVPLLRELVALFLSALEAKNNEIPKGGLLNSSSQQQEASPELVDEEILDQFISILDHLMLPSQQNKQLVGIKHRINKGITCDSLISCFLETFDLLSKNLEQERTTAETFLSSLNETLSTVQTAVNKTLLSNKAFQNENDKLNLELKSKINAMTSKVSQSDALGSIKEDINAKIAQIAGIVQKKAELEKLSQKRLDARLLSMQKEIKALETKSKQFETRLHEQHLKSMQDALTKINNRAAFDEHFAKEMVRFHKHAFPLSIVVIDLDDFKSINDTYGHTAGDKTLQVISNTMKKCTPDDAFIARYGGEEFVIIFNKLNKDELVKHLNAMREKIAKLPFKFKNNKVSITVSIGATHVKQEDNIHLAFERADTGLYEAKAKGKNRVIYV